MTIQRAFGRVVPKAGASNLGEGGRLVLATPTAFAELGVAVSLRLELLRLESLALHYEGGP